MWWFWDVRRKVSIKWPVSVVWGLPYFLPCLLCTVQNVCPASLSCQTHLLASGRLCTDLEQTRKIWSNSIPKDSGKCWCHMISTQCTKLSSKRNKNPSAKGVWSLEKLTDWCLCRVPISASWLVHQLCCGGRPLARVNSEYLGKAQSEMGLSTAHFSGISIMSLHLMPVSYSLCVMAPGPWCKWMCPASSHAGHLWPIPLRELVSTDRGMILNGIPGAIACMLPVPSSSLLPFLQDSEMWK